MEKIHFKKQMNKHFLAVGEGEEMFGCRSLAVLERRACVLLCEDQRSKRGGAKLCHPPQLLRGSSPSTGLMNE